MRIITFATDFGTADGYTGAVKGVIKSLAPECEIVEITNELQSTMKAAIALFRYSPWFPDGAIHLVIVDPTVGGGRRALAGFDGRHYFVGPDNGVFSMLSWNDRGVDWYNIREEMLPPGQISATFHARDIFGPAAALLALGHLLSEIGTKIDDPIMLEIPRAREKENSAEGEIIDIDSFGNLIINVPADLLAGSISVMLGDKPVPFGITFSDVPAGAPIAYIGSLGFLEIAVNCGRADDHFKARVGSKVRVES